MGRASGQQHATATTLRSAGRRPAPAVALAEATPADIAELAALMASVAKRTYSAAHAGPALDRWLADTCTEAHFRYRVGRSGYRVIVARDAHGRIIGTGTLRQRGDRADLSGIYVSCPGGGVGRSILCDLERIAAEIGCTRTRASVWRTNEPAKSFFEARGLARNGGYREPTVGVMVDHYEGALPLSW